jgi:hypothetical protein
MRDSVAGNFTIAAVGAADSVTLNYTNATIRR